MSGRIGMRVGESLVAGGPAGTAAEPEVVIGELDGPVGTAFATLLGDQVKGHSRVLAIMNTDIQVRPATLMVSKVTVKDERYTNILMGTVQGAIANGVFLESELAASRTILEVLLKARMSQRLYRSEAWYPVFNGIDPVIQEALNLWTSANDLVTLYQSPASSSTGNGF